MSIFKKLGWFFKQEKKSYIVGVSLLFLVALLQAINPWITGKLIDEIANRILTFRSLFFWLMLMVLSTVGQYIFRFLWRSNIFGTSAKLEFILRKRLFHHFTQMDATFYQEHRTGDLMAHATNDLSSIRMVAGSGILTLADSLITGGLTLLSMLVVVDWRLTILVVFPLPLLTAVSRLLGTKIHKEFKIAQATFSRLNDKTQESISGVKVIKTFGEEEADILDYERLTKEVVEANKRVVILDSLFNPAITLVLGLTFALTIIFGGYFVSVQIISIGQLVSFISYLGMMTWPMLAVGRLFNVLERGSASYDRIEELLAQKTCIIESDYPVVELAKGCIEINIDEFTYPTAKTAALSDIQVTIQPGQTLGIVGKTGSGKSSLFRLLLREYDQYQGEIKINGISIREYSLDALLMSIGYVPQDHFLFSTSISQNIAFANPSISQNQIEEVAKMVAIHDDILEFKEGYETLVGERGVSLSGGQKQRLSIARALLTNPEFLMLDDALSAVDAKTEEAILSSLKEVRSDKTTIIAAHRISSVLHADEIIVLDQGRIVERGTHQELLNLGGWYYEMYEKQQIEMKLEGGTVNEA